MLGDNLRDLRKKKGMSQEELATRINVVRQTVSKWEKNISVPDAEMLQKIAAELDAGVEELLGEKISEKHDTDEIAQQLARINEQLAVRNKKGGRILKTVLIVIAVLIALRIALAAAGFVIYKGNVHTSGTVEMSYENSDDAMYDEDELISAMDTLEGYFDDHMQGCRLDGINYQEPDDYAEFERYAKTYQTEFAIVLTADFATDGKVKTDAASAKVFDADADTFAANKTYKHVKWILTKSGTQDWTVQGYGY